MKEKGILAKYCVLAIDQNCWKTTTMDLIADTDELQEFFSDFHSNPAVLYIPLLHNHYKLGIIVKLNWLTYDVNYSFENTILQEI